MQRGGQLVILFHRCTVALPIVGGSQSHVALTTAVGSTFFFCFIFSSYAICSTKLKTERESGLADGKKDIRETGEWSGLKKDDNELEELAFEEVEEEEERKEPSLARFFPLPVR